MFELIFCQYIFWQLVALASPIFGVNLSVQTDSGPIVGVLQKTFVNQMPYISYKGIPYAEPPIGPLRFKATRQCKPWTKPLVTTNEYQNGCIAVSTVIFQLNTKQSEDCLYLNVYTPVLGDNKSSENLPVVFYIHGGGFAEGDGSDLYQGPDFMLEENIVLVTINYRLGPFGFANFEAKGFNGNMGLKDQREALRWVKNNINYFGGDSNAITISGESAGAVSSHLLMLTGLCKNIKRALMFSGSAFNYIAYYEENNHLDLIREAFKDDLGNQTSNQDVLNFMINASTERIIEKSPFLYTVFSVPKVYWTPVIEDVNLAENPFLTQRPHEIYKSEEFKSACKNVEVVFSLTSTESKFFINPTDPYGFVNIDANLLPALPYHGLTLPTNSSEYQAKQAEIKKFYFGEGEIKATPERLNQFAQLASDMAFVIPFYEAMRLQSRVSDTFCTYSDIQLNTNMLIPRKLDMIDGMGHVEDTGYFFKLNQFSAMYNATISDPTNAQNQRTMKAWKYVTKLYIDFAKTGSLNSVSPLKSIKAPQCVYLTNNGLELIIKPHRKPMTEIWDKMRKSIDSYIVNEY